MSGDQTLETDGQFALNNMQISAADSAGSHAKENLPRPDFGPRNFIDL